jgi:ABC-type dipeptide/oligopeptide/nickel transport system ATPase component
VTAFSILRLLQPPGRIASGRVVFEGRDLLSLSERDMRQVRGARISLIFQEPMTALNPVMRVGDQIAEAMTVHGQADRHQALSRAAELLDAVHIPDAARRVHDYPHQLSGGMRQRVMIAIALACHPPLVIADEPTTALDVTIQAQVLDLLRELRGRYNLALLLITHDFGVIAEMADRVAVMHNGLLVEQGPVRQILRTPTHDYTRRLLAAVPGMRVDGPGGRG